MSDEFAARLRSLMELHGIHSSRELGEICGVSSQAAHRWLNGGDITPNNAQLLAARFNVDWLWLRYGDEAHHERRSHDPLAERRRLLIEDIRSNELRLRLAVEAARLGVWEVNLLTGALYWDTTTCELFGRTPAEAPKSPQEFFPLIWPEDYARLRQAFDRFLAKPVGVFHTRYRYTHRDGHVRYFVEYARLIHDPDGTPVRIVGLVRDETATQQLLNTPCPQCGYRRQPEVNA